MALHLEHDWFDRPVPSNVRLGERTWLYSSFAFLHYASARPCGLRVGDDTGIYITSFFDLGPEGEVEIGNYCSLVGAKIASNGRIVIGDYVFIAHEVVIADSFAAVPYHPLSAARETGRPLPRHTANQRSPVVEIGDDVWIGARAVLLGGARVGAGAIIGAGAVIDGEVPPYSIVAGNPARVVGQVPRRT